jgi:DNA-binding MarR family transcriptional regulator
VNVAGFDSLANRLGALALRVTDRMSAAVRAEGVASLSAVTALSSLERFFVQHPSIDELRRVLGVTSSGAVRVVDGLEAGGLVTRRAGADARVSSIAMTAKGRRAAARISEARARVLAELVAALDHEQRARLAPLVDALLMALVQPSVAGPAMCRLCATEVCGAARGRPCPVTIAALS